MDGLTFPGITPKMIRQNPLQVLATYQGYLKIIRQNKTRLQLTPRAQPKRTSNNSILKLLDSFPPKSFIKTSHSPFLRATIIDEELLDKTEKELPIDHGFVTLLIYLYQA